VSVNAFRSEQRQLLGVRSLVVADEISITVCAFQLEVPVVGCQPRVEYFRNGDAPVTEDQRAWRLLAAMAAVTLDANAEEAFFRQVRSPYGVAAQNRSRRRQIRVAAHEATQSVSRYENGVWAVTPALELVRFRSQDPANKRYSSGGRAPCKRL